MSTLAFDSINSESLFFQLTQGEKQRALTISTCYWIVFGICFVMRLALVLCWKLHGTSRRHHEKMTAIFMFFSMVQWMFYVVGYYVMLDTVSNVTWKVRLQSNTNA